MQFTSLRNRIAVTFLILILLLQLGGFIATRISINNNARASINEQLQVGEKVFVSLLRENSENLAQGARILATDYGFRQAITSNDLETLLSALSNYQMRINANIAMFYSADGHLQGIAGHAAESGMEKSVGSLVATAITNGEAQGLAIFDNQPYQLVVVPVKAPLTIGWIVMGFVINDNLALRLRSLSLLHVSFLTRIGHESWVPVASTMDMTTAGTIAKMSPSAITGNAINTELNIEDTLYGTRYVTVFDHDNQAMVAVLQRSIDEATAPYEALKLNLLLLSLFGALIFIISSLFTAKRISQPLTELVETAEKLEQGNYAVAIESSRKDEIGNLARAFNQMREAIAIREKKILKLAYEDELTQLPNRISFTDLLEKALKVARADQQTLSVLMMDLDRFKQINDVLGQAAANELLRGVAERLKTICRSERGDVVARLGGDEFAIMLPNTDIATATTTVQRMQKALEEPILIGEQLVDLSAGMGLACYPQHASEVELLLSRAEMAMYVAKAAKSNFVIYDTKFDFTSQENLSLAGELKLAIDHNQLKLYLQPKICMETGRVCGAEALVRWIHPERGLIAPDNFIPFAEQTGHVRKISLWMLDEVGQHLAKWQRHGLDITIAVNLSARDLMDQDLPSKLGLILYKYNLEPQTISLEITESAIMDDPVRAQNTLERIHKMGISMSIDDFGTGFSSLSYLKRLPVNELKIDKSFVLNMENDIDDSKIVRSTIELGHNLGLKVVAEGIETQATWNILEKMGCDYGQGYFMSKPMPADELSQWITHWEANKLH